MEKTEKLLNDAKEALGILDEKLKTATNKRDEITKRQQQIIDERFKSPNGDYFTYKMLSDLCIYYDFIEDLYYKYECNCIMDLRKKLL